MTETALKERIQELERARQRSQDAMSAAHDAANAAYEAANATQADIEKFIRRLVEERPEQALQLRDALRVSATPPSRTALADLVKTIANMSALLAEFGSPSTVPVTPARLSEVWASVGGYLRHGMREMDKRFEHHG